MESDYLFVQNSDDTVDLRSDTVTRPTKEMYERMLQAPLGDDGLDGDPTAIELEESVAKMLGKESGLFTPSCTMANLLAVLSQTKRTEQVVVESTAHMFISEKGGATFTGQFYQPISGTSGAMDLSLLEELLHDVNPALPVGLVAMETSHNNSGGSVLPLSHMKSVYALANLSGIRVHLDGARLFNAATALRLSPAQITQHSDTVSLCLSKGLSAPVGAVLAGDHATIKRARSLRRMLGGAQRQVGIVAAAGMTAIETMGGRLGEDHARAKLLADKLRKLAPTIVTNDPETNILIVDVGMTPATSVDWVNSLAKRGVLARPWGKQKLRCVTHRHITDANIDRAFRAFEEVFLSL
jgi:threonine aldolase